MKPHRILKSFTGSQTGHDSDSFVEGTERLLSPSLAKIVVGEGWAEPVAAKAAVISEEKSLNEAPANKAKKAAPENKAKKAE